MRVECVWVGCVWVWVGCLFGCGLRVWVGCVCGWVVGLWVWVVECVWVGGYSENYNDNYTYKKMNIQLSLLPPTHTLNHPHSENLHTCETPHKNTQAETSTDRRTVRHRQAQRRTHGRTDREKDTNKTGQREDRSKTATEQDSTRDKTCTTDKR